MPLCHARVTMLGYIDSETTIAFISIIRRLTLELCYRLY